MRKEYDFSKGRRNPYAASLKRIKLTKEEKAIENALIRGEYVSASKAEFNEIKKAIRHHRFKQVLRECTQLAFEDRITFPETVMRLAGAGIERYCADLVRLEKFYYTPEGKTHTEPMPLKSAPAIAQKFEQTAVKDAIAAIQKKQIDYPEFLRRIMRAGVVYYDVFIHGRKAIYTGRDGDFHVEHFPGGK